MVRWIRVILSLVFLALSVSAFSQAVTNSGNTNTISRQLGGLAADKWLILPSDTLPELTTSLIRHGGLLAYKYPNVYIFDTVLSAWVIVGSDSGDNQNLQEVTDVGNTTTNEIIIGSTRDTGNLKLQVYGNGAVTNSLWVGDHSTFFGQFETSRGMFRYDSTQPANAAHNAVQGVSVIGLTSNATRSSFGVLGSSVLKSTNTATWGTQASGHPVAGGGSFTYSGGTNGTSGTVPYVTAIYGTVATPTSGSVSFPKASLATLGYAGNSGGIVDCIGFTMHQVSQGSRSNTYYHATNVNEAQPYPGNWFINTADVTYRSFHRGEFNIADSADLGDYALQVAGAEVTTGLDNYNSDISGTFTSRSKIDKGYADATYSTISGLSAYRQKADSGTSGANVYVTPTGVRTIGDAVYQPIGSYEVPLTFSTGLTRTTNTITNNVSTGVSGGQTINGGTAANDDLTIEGTTHATKTTSYVNLQTTGGNVGIGTTTPGAILHVAGTPNGSVARFDNSTNGGAAFFTKGATSIGLFGAEAIWQGSGSSTEFAIGSYTASGIRFHVNNSTNTALYLTSSENAEFRGKFTRYGNAVPAANQILVGDGTDMDLTNIITAYNTALAYVVTSAGTLSPSVNTNVYFNGTTATYTLPAVAGNANTAIMIRNAGTGTITVNSSAGGNDIVITTEAAAANTVAVLSGEQKTFRNKTGTLWVIE